MRVAIIGVGILARSIHKELEGLGVRATVISKDVPGFMARGGQMYPWTLDGLNSPRSNFYWSSEHYVRSTSLGFDGGACQAIENAGVKAYISTYSPINAAWFAEDIDGFKIEGGEVLSMLGGKVTGVFDRVILAREDGSNTHLLRGIPTEDFSSILPATVRGAWQIIDPVEGPEKPPRMATTTFAGKEVVSYDFQIDQVRRFRGYAPQASMLDVFRKEGDVVLNQGEAFYEEIGPYVLADKSEQILVVGGVGAYGGPLSGGLAYEASRRLLDL